MDRNHLGDAWLDLRQYALHGSTSVQRSGNEHGAITHRALLKVRNLE
jgi:hypothetical protein